MKGCLFFFRSCLKVLTALSVSPLVWGCLGELVTWVNPYSVANSVNS